MSVFRVGSNKSSVNNFPSVRPTLDLDFANSKTLDPRITFTRASGGSYVGADGYIKFAGVNEARFDHDPYTGESLGLLVEESRTNLITYSEDFVSGWSGNLNTQVNTDTILNPYGVLGTVYYITVSELTSSVFNANGLSTLALSFFSKRRFGGLNRDFSNIEIFQQSVGGGSLGTYNFRFDGNNPNSGQFQNIRTERYQNDWYRFSCTLVARPDYNGGVFGPDARVDLEGGSADNYFWGIQVESGEFATSYIPTVGSTRTRAADNASITGKNFSSWYRQDEGSFLVNFNNKIHPSSILDMYLVSIFDSSNISRRMSSRIGGQESGVYISTMRSFAFLTDFTYAVEFISNTYTSGNGKSIFNYEDVNYFSQCLNGGNISLDATGNISQSGFNILVVGRESDTNRYLNGTISRLSYYPVRLSNSQLQTLTS